MTAQEAIQEMQGSILSHPYFNSRSNEALVLEQHINDCADNVLARFPDPLGLVRTGKNTFAESGTSGQPLIGAATSAGLGRILSNTLELANVDLGTQFIDMIAAQRGFQANSRVITTSDEVLQELVNLKR